jgi:hypothetical protein
MSQECLLAHTHLAVLPFRMESRTFLKTSLVRISVNVRLRTEVCLLFQLGQTQGTLPKSLARNSRHILSVHYEYELGCVTVVAGESRKKNVSFSMVTVCVTSRR